MTLDEALAAAPEHTAPECNCYLSNGAHRSDCPQWRTAEERLMFSPAAEAHLDRLQRAGDAEVERLKRQAQTLAGFVDAANARAEAAERRDKETERLLGNVMRQRDAAESEAASLRSERDKVLSQYELQAQRAEASYDEAAALRAEVVSLRKALARAGEDAARDRVDADAWAVLLSERDEAKTNWAHFKEESRVFRAHRNQLEKQLAAATALLESLRWEPSLPEFQKAAIVALLSNATPAPNERAAAERAVLEAMANVNTAWLDEVSRTSCGPLGAACRAELARRAAK